MRSEQRRSRVHHLLFTLALLLLIPACGAMIGSGPRAETAGPPLLTDADIDVATPAPSAEVLELVGAETEAPWAEDDDAAETSSPDTENAVATQAMPPGASGVVVFVLHDPNAAEPWRLVRVDAGTGSTTNIYQGMREIQSAAVSLDGNVLAFAMRHEVGGHFEVYRFVVSVGLVERLTTTADDNLDVSIAASGETLAWSGLTPNGRRSVFVRQYSGGTFTETLLATTADQVQPSLSGDGRHVAFIRPGSRYYVYLFDRVGESYVRVVSRSGEMTHPSVSDGAQKVAWYIPSNRSVRLKYLDSGGAITATKHWAEIEHPFLTSDGEYIVFGRQDAGSLDVFTWSEDTGELYQLTSTADPVNHRGMSWQVGTLTGYGLTVERTGSGTVTSDPAGIACGTTCSATYAAGTSVALQAEPAAGWSFTGWSGACSGTSECTIPMNGPQSVSATFTEDAVPTSEAIAPVQSTCSGTALDSECTVAIALQNASGSYEGMEFRFTSSSFSLVRANSVISSTTGDCLAQAGPTKVIVVCSEPFDRSGDVVSLTLRRSGTAASSAMVSEAFLAPGGSMPLLGVDGGSLAIAGTN